MWFLLLTEAVKLLEQLSSHLNENQLIQLSRLREAISAGDPDFDNYNYE